MKTTRARETKRVYALLLAAREIDAAMDEACVKEAVLWMDTKSSDRVYHARCALGRAIEKFPKRRAAPGAEGG